MGDRKELDLSHPIHRPRTRCAKVPNIKKVQDRDDQSPTSSEGCEMPPDHEDREAPIASPEKTEPGALDAPEIVSREPTP